MERWLSLTSSSSWRSSWASIIIFYWGLVVGFMVVVTESFIIPTTTSTPLLRRLAQPIPYIQYQQHCRVLSNHDSVGYGGITTLSSQQQNTIEKEKEKSATTKTKRRNWEESFQLLVSYKEKHGNCNVPQKYREDHRLGYWVDRQRSRKDRLSDERIEKLDVIGFSWANEIYEEQWDEMFEKLRRYAKENNGDCNIPYNDDNNDVNKELHTWVKKQRVRKSLISKERRAKLDKLGLIWEDANKVKADQKWNEQYESLKDYKEEHGHCLVPQRWKEDPSLGLWVYKQRQNYRIGQLHEDRKIKLEEMDFTWKVRDAPGGSDVSKLDFNWSMMYGRLLNFLEEHGHCDVPRNYKKDKSLAFWVFTQRTNQKKKILHKDRKERLDDIGFTWSFDDQKDEQWNETYKELKRFKEQNGHLRLPETSRSLINWVYFQRIQFAAGKVSPERKALLDEIDFQWSIETRSG